VTSQMREFAFDQRLCFVEFGDRRHHREHDLEFAPRAGAQQGPNLAAQQAGPVEPEPDRTPAERWVLFLDIAHVGQDLIAADIERAEYHRSAGGCVEHRAIEQLLLVNPRHRCRDHELQFGAKQPDARCTGLGDMWQIDQEPSVEHQRHRLAVLAHAWPFAQGKVLLLTPGP